MLIPIIANSAPSEIPPLPDGDVYLLNIKDSDTGQNIPVLGKKLSNNYLQEIILRKFPLAWRDLDIYMEGERSQPISVASRTTALLYGKFQSSSGSAVIRLILYDQDNVYGVSPSITLQPIPVSFETGIYVSPIAIVDLCGAFVAEIYVESSSGVLTIFFSAI